MKAIQVKYLGPTDTLGSRLKAWSASRMQIVEAVDYGMRIEEQAEVLASRYALKMNWGVLSGFGVLPNGDWVGVL